MSKTCPSFIVPSTALLWNQRFGRSERGSLIFENNPSVCNNYLVFFTYVANVSKDENKLLLTFFFCCCCFRPEGDLVSSPLSWGGDNLRWTSVPSRRSSDTSSHLVLRKPKLSAGCLSHTPYRLSLLPTSTRRKRKGHMVKHAEVPH